MELWHSKSQMAMMAPFSVLSFLGWDGSFDPKPCNLLIHVKAVSESNQGILVSLFVSVSLELGDDVLCLLQNNESCGFNGNKSS